MPPLQSVDHTPPPPQRPSSAHKGTFGTVIIIGGSPTMIGAPAICAAAALRSGAGLVRIATAPEVLPHTLTIEPGATGIRLEGHVDRQLAAIEQADPDHRAILAIGPGLGTAEAARKLVLAVLRGRRPIVLDADGLNILAETAAPRPANGPALVMTPHPGEFQRLARPLEIEKSPTDRAERPIAAARLARAHHAITLLKGRRTVVTDGNRVYLNATGNPALATAGSGDVLTGVVAALIAQGMDPFDAACLGAHVHGLAADRWASRYGPAGLAATELAREIPHALHAVRERAQGT